MSDGLKYLIVVYDFCNLLSYIFFVFIGLQLEKEKRDF